MPVTKLTPIKKIKNKKTTTNKTTQKIKDRSTNLIPYSPGGVI
jgi:hypothetical protein